MMVQKENVLDTSDSHHRVKVGQASVAAAMSKTFPQAIFAAGSIDIKKDPLSLSNNTSHVCG